MQRRNLVTTVATYCLLAGAAVTSFLLPETLPGATASGPTGEITLIGVVRDFRPSHVDFNVIPPEGAGHSAGNVQMGLGSDGRPLLSTGSDNNGPFESRIAHWKLDDGNGLTASDEMGANPGTLLSGPTWAAGRDGGALRFDGVDDYVEVPSSPEMQITGDITFAGWFKLDADFDATSPDTMVIMEKFLDTEHDFHIALAGLDYNRPEVPKGTLVFKVENGPTSDYYCYTWTNRANWTADTWYYFAASLVSADTAQNRIFINGVEDTDPAIAVGIGFTDTDFDAPIRFGGRTVDYNGLATDIYFQGTLDDVIIFDRALTAGDFIASAGGYMVSTEWHDAASQPIAPHLARAGGSVALTTAPNLSSNAIVDTWDSSLGPYGGTNVGSFPVFTVGAHVPAVSIPTTLGPSVGDLTYAGPMTVSADVHSDALSIDDLVQVSGSLTWLTEDLFAVVNHAELELLAGADLTIYAMNGVSLGTKVTTGVPAGFNENTADPRRLTIYNLGSQPVVIEPHASVYATIVSPYAEMIVKNEAAFFGSFAGLGLTLKGNAEFHVDSLPPLDSCDNPLTDTFGLAGADTDGGITSPASFNQWFRDSLGNNLSTSHDITLTLNGSVYEYLDDDFHPIDDRLLGNAGQANNHHLTYALCASFTYDACTGQFVEFEGGDGAWAFIGGQLVLDLGGVASSVDQRIDLDRLRLTDGQMYVFHLFYAQRQANTSAFRLRTNIPLTTAGRIVVGSAGFD